MPKPDTTTNRITESVAEKPKSQAQKDLPEVKYPELFTTFAMAEDAITGELAAALLGLETEEDWARRVAAEHGLANGDKTPKLKLAAENVTFVVPSPHPLAGTKVACWNNLHNRPFEVPSAMSMVQELLTFNWAGPTTCPGETINGESITISRAAQVLSGQKRLGAAWMAWQWWLLDHDKWHHFWPKDKYPNGPVLESLLVYGVSDALRVVQTIDTGDKRTESDAFYTANVLEKVFSAKELEGMTPKHRQIGTGMLQAGVDFLWKRLGWDKRLIKTNRAAQEFLDGFPSLYKATKVIYKLNEGRVFSLMRLSPGTCSAALYLMAQGKSNPMKDFDSERGLDVTLWAKAEAFWAEFAKKQGMFLALSEALVKLVNQDEEELNGNVVQKFCLIAKAWHAWLAGKKLGVADLTLATEPDDNGVPKLVDPPDFGGADRGPRVSKVETDPPEPTPAEIKEAAKKARSAELHKNGNGGAVVEETPAQEKARRNAVLSSAPAVDLLAKKQAAAKAKANGKPPANPKPVTDAPTAARPMAQTGTKAGRTPPKSVPVRK